MSSTEGKNCKQESDAKAYNGINILKKKLKMIMMAVHVSASACVV